jgi:hypothetical protein
MEIGSLSPSPPLGGEGWGEGGKLLIFKPSNQRFCNQPKNPPFFTATGLAINARRLFC